MEEVKAKDVLKGAVAGVVGGLAGTLVMGKFQSLVSPLLSDGSESKQEKDEPANVKAADAISENMFDHYLTADEKKTAGQATHFAMGMTSGLIYGIASEIAPVTSSGAGLPFGTAVWIVADNIAVPGLGLSKPLTQYPLSQHAYALSSHLIYGLATDLVRRAVRAAL